MDYKSTTHDDAFRVVNDQTAEWAVKAIKASMDERDRLVSVCEAEISRLQYEIAEANKRFDNETAFLKDQLYGYFLDCKRKDTKTQQSYRLPSGKLVFTKPKPDYERDPDKLVDWLVKQGRDDLVKFSYEPKWADTKAMIAYVDGEYAVTEDGEIIDGITVVMRPGHFDIKMED